MKKKIVIIGAGFGGLRVLYNLEKYKDKFDFTVINKTDYSLERPALPEVAIEGKPVSKAQIKIKDYLEKKGINFKLGEVKEIKPERNEVIVDEEIIPYDYLIIATGSIKDYDSIKGYREYGYSVCDDKEASKLYERLKTFEGGNVVVGAARSYFGHVVEAPDLKAPCEGPVGEVMFMIDHRLRKEGKREKSSINVFTPGEIFFEDVGDNPRNTVGKFMEERGIKLHLNKELVEITDKEVIFKDGSSLPCDLAIIIAPYKAPDFIKESGLGDDMGWVPTDRTMKHIKYDNIYAVGDVNALAQPKLGHIAVMQADVASSAIEKQEGLTDEIKPFKPEVFCIMNMGGFEATLILSNALYENEYDIAWHSPIAKLMKISFDEEYYYAHGKLPPDFMIEISNYLIKKLFGGK
ncbi:FAD/NAD(P)-binding oxidoreductase [Venenivibrio stagnispumantis]|uniref:Sulfide-quinone oxidoreductase n=1 Tax=Venenivibrio stagnispumantis TaxID=407998 RepID=A0AA46ADT1_9AQUI|nr:FAD-dependent oxidoreductase [Venenivibrio stagnispumantis]MCW4573036.1 FAD-dependent oxidoreductase [Venenivibrio stagnispumantis]SMP07457.1 sulfide-quinone oxidoreductase [Venenivibrio stagnispumantis]